MDHDEEPATDRAPKLVARPRIVHVTTSHRADDVRIFERECRSLAATGAYDVFLAAHGSIPSDSGVTLIPFGTRPSSRLRRFASGPLKAGALAGALDLDLWHFHDPELLPVAIRLARSGKRVIWDAHEDYVAQFGEDGSKSWVPQGARSVVRSGMATLLRTIDKWAAAIVAATPTIAGRYANSRTVVVGNEARLEDFAGVRPDFAARRVLFAGSMSSAHLFPEIVDAIAGLPDVRLAVAGREPEPVAWANATSRLGSRVVHLGWLDRAGMAAEMSRSSLGLSTYADIPTNADNRPNKMFESGAGGLPVVATPNRSNLDFVEQGAAAFVAGGFSAQDLKASIQAALSDSDEWLRASLSGRKWAAREGSWAASEGRLLALYADVLGDPAPSTRRKWLR